MENNKRMLVAIILSTLILVGFMYYQSITAPQVPIDNSAQNDIIDTNTGIAIDSSSLENVAVEVSLWSKCEPQRAATVSCDH